MRRIYLDHAASTPVAPEVAQEMAPYFAEQSGNPGSLHAFGQEAIAAIDVARERIAKAIGADFRQIVFTGSATEANNLALQGAIKKFRSPEGGKSGTASHTRPRIIISAIEHESVLETAHALEGYGVEVIVLPVDRHGVISIEEIKKHLTPATALVSVIYANNEMGSIAPIAEIGRVIAEFRATTKAPGATDATSTTPVAKNVWPLFHTDAAQAFQFFDCNVKTLGVDMMTLSSHKICGPKGAGALYIKEAKAIEPIIYGGGQEFGLRSGTENVPAIVGFGKAAEVANGLRHTEFERTNKLSETFWKGVKTIYPKAEINGPELGKNRMPNILNIYYPGIAAQDLLTRLDRRGVAASSGSACRSRALEASYVIEALGHTKERARESIRWSFGRSTTEADIAESLKILKECLA